jgi:hypothetical protein
VQRVIAPGELQHMKPKVARQRSPENLEVRGLLFDAIEQVCARAACVNSLPRLTDAILEY